MTRNAAWTITDRATPACKSGRQRGFTVIELLIATLIFSLVLLLITVGIITFTKAFYKGVNQSKTQSAARNIMETISQAIQFSGGEVTAPVPNNPADPRYICVGDRRFSYIQGWQIKDQSPDPGKFQSRHALVLDESGVCNGAQDVRGTVTGTELLDPNMRISKLSVEQVGATDLYRVTVRIAYGDGDLLYSPSQPNNANGATREDATCRLGFSGGQFCATSELSTTVKKRIGQ